MRPFAALLALALPAFAGDYLVLSSVDPKDPYYAAATAIADFHKAGTPVAFDPEHPDAILPKLKELHPVHVAIVLRPDELDINLARRFLRVAAQVDSDPFVDFSYGFITGATPEDAKAFVANIVRASSLKRPLTVGQGVVWGGDGGCRADDIPYTAGALSLPSHRLAFVAPDGQHGRDQKFIDENLPSLGGKGAVMFGGHGMPWEIGSGPRPPTSQRSTCSPPSSSTTPATPASPSSGTTRSTKPKPSCTRSRRWRLRRASRSP